MQSCCRILKPTAIGRLVSYFSKNSEAITKSDAYFYAGMVITIYFVEIFLDHGYNLYVMQLAQKMKIAVSSLVYRTSLKMATSSIAEISIGKIVVLITKDVMTFEFAAIFTNDIWIGVIQLFVMTYVIYIHMGLAAFPAVGFLLLITPIQRELHGFC